MMIVKVYGVMVLDLGVYLFDIECCDLCDIDVVIFIDYCGVCYLDFYIVENDWGGISYLIVFGYEIVGIVIVVGFDVIKFRVGDKVGVGCLVDLCGYCGVCEYDEEQFCEEGIYGMYGGVDCIDGILNYGGYLEVIVVKEFFVFLIFDVFDFVVVVLILCVGIIIYLFFKYVGVKKGDKVGVFGMGGFGYMGVKFVKVMGVEVIIFMCLVSKVEEVFSQGVDYVIILIDEVQMIVVVE